VSGPAGEGPVPLSARRLWVYVVVLSVLTAGVVLVCTLFGLYEMTEQIWRFRLLRLIAAAAVGAGLASAGMALQGLLRNPLAEPYILGISSGATVAVLLGIASGLSGVTAARPGTPVLAFVGAAVTCLIVYGIAQRRGRLNPYVLLLAGVIVNAFNGAIILALLMFVDPNEMASFIRWTMGGLVDVYDPTTLGICLACILVGWGVLFFRAAWLNALGLGDDVAASMGVGVHRLRLEVFFVVALMTAAAVSLAGPVGFLGLIVPHLCRMALGADHRRLVVFSGFAGAVFLVVVETLCRNVGPRLGVGYVPLGIVTALCGGPFFIYLLRSRAGVARV
jgi:iron complex transport system permease protein